MSSPLRVVDENLAIGSQNAHLIKNDVHDRNSLESQLAAAQKQIQILHQRLCSARAMHCRVEGTAHFVNTSAGAWNSFDILSVDEVGIPCNSGGDNFVVNMSGPAPTEVVVEDNNDGTYTVKCCATKVGVYTITVSLEDCANISFASSAVTVYAVAPEPNMCVASGKGLLSMQAGYNASFEICCFDKFGNPSPMPEGDELERIDVLITGGDNFEMQSLQDEGEGRYLVRYIVRDEAEWAIDILVDGAPIRDSPFQPGFDAGATNPSKCHVFGDCFHQECEAGWEATITLIAKDGFSNNRISGGDAVTVAVSAPDGQVSMVPQGSAEECGRWWDVGDGTYHAKLRFTMSGTYEVDVGVNDIVVGGGESHSVYVLPAAPAPEHFVADLKGLTRGVAGEPMHFIMEARDQYDNACIMDMDQVQVIMSAEGSEVQGALVPVEGDPATCEVELVCTRAHSYSLVTCYGGMPVPVAQMELTVDANDTAPLQSTLFADTDPRRAAGTTDGLSEAYLGIPAQFYVRANDEFGNPRTTGGDDVKVTCIPDEEPAIPPAGVHMSDIGDGTYRVTYLACKAGPHKITISVNDQDIEQPSVVDVSMGNPWAKTKQW